MYLCQETLAHLKTQRGKPSLQSSAPAVVKEGRKEHTFFGKVQQIYVLSKIVKKEFS